MSPLWTVALCIASFAVGFVLACVLALSGRWSDEEERDRAWIAENIPESMP